MPNLEFIGFHPERQESLLDHQAISCCEWCISELSNHSLEIGALHLKIRKVNYKG